MCPGVVILMSSPSTTSFSFGEINKLVAVFPNIESKWVAACLIDLDGEETSASTGKMKRSSSVNSLAEAPIMYSAKRHGNLWFTEACKYEKLFHTKYLLTDN